MKIEIYAPAVYCLSGACGMSVKPEVLRMKVALLHIQRQAPAVQVERYDLAADPEAFAANSTVAELLASDGPECLPLVFVAGELISKGHYPNDERLQTAVRHAGLNVTLGRRIRTAMSGGAAAC